jgi:hypothetical protein
VNCDASARQWDEMRTLLAVYDDGLSSRSTVPVRNGGIVTCMGVETDKLEGYYVTDGPWLPQAFPYREAQIIPPLSNERNQTILSQVTYFAYYNGSS